MLFSVSENINSGKQEKEYYKAVVVDNKDPKRASRVKCLVENRLEVPASQYDRLPWIMPDQGSSTGGREDTGGVRVPPIGSEVKVRFIDDDPYMGMYSGSMESKEFFNDTLFGVNYPNVEGQMNTDGTWSRTDREKGWSEDFDPKTGAYDKRNEDGKRVINLPGDVLINVLGRLDINVEEGVFLWTNDMVLDLDSFNTLVHGTMNTKADTINRDATLINDQKGVATPLATAASLAATTRVSPNLAELESTLDDLQASTEAIQKSAQQFNRALVEKGIPDINGEPTIGSTDSFTKQVVDYSGASGLGTLFDLQGLLSGNLLSKLLSAVPGVRDAVAVVQSAANIAQQISTTASRVGVLADALTSFNPTTDLNSANSALTNLDNLLTTIGQASDPVAAIRSNLSQVNSQLAEVKTAVSALQVVQQARIELPDLRRTLESLPVDGTFDNQTARNELLDQIEQLSAVDITELPALTAKAQALQQVANMALALERTQTSLDNLDGGVNPVQVKLAQAHLGDLNYNVTI